MRRFLRFRFPYALATAATVAALLAAAGGADPSPACPCSLFESDAPALTALATQDGRPAPGPWSYELGVRFAVSQPALLTGIAFYKDAGETGSHLGSLWSDSGSLLAQTSFGGESGSGRQTAAFATPVALSAGTAYVVSVNANAFFVMTRQGLGSGASNPPLSVPAGGGVFGSAAGSFPSSTFDDSNYLVAPIVELPSTPAAPASPAAAPQPATPPAPSRAGYCDPKTGLFYDLVAGQNTEPPYDALGLVPAHEDPASGALDCAFPRIDPAPATTSSTATAQSLTLPVSVAIDVVSSNLPRHGTVTSSMRSWLAVHPQGDVPDRFQLAESTDSPWSWRATLSRFTVRSRSRTIFIRFARGTLVGGWQRISLLP